MELFQHSKYTLQQQSHTRIKKTGILADLIDLFLCWCPTMADTVLNMGKYFKYGEIVFVTRVAYTASDTPM